MIGPLNKDDVIAGRYKILDYYSQGGMQYVYLAIDTVTERTIALKTPKNLSAEKRFARSAIVSAKVNHPNVAKTFDYVDENGRTFLIEEFIDGLDLKQAILDRAEYVDPYLVAKIFHHLAKGVAAAHHQKVIHRDLKPSNIMVTGGFNLRSLKVTDFGIAKMAEAEMEEAVEGGAASISASATAVGALPYMAPEAIETPEAVGLPADVWSIGAIVLHLLYGNYPFGSGLKAVPRILAADVPPPPKFVLSNAQFEPLAQEIVNIVFSCLAKDPLSRPTCDELVLACNNLCYTASERYEGVVLKIFHDKYGFISGPSGDVFYHRDSVYGAIPREKERVLFSCYSGGQAPRALPVLKILA